MPAGARARPRKVTRSRKKTQGRTCDKHRLRVEQAGGQERAWTGRSGPGQAGDGLDGQEAAWTGKSRQAGMNKLGTRLYLVPLPMMET